MQWLQLLCWGGLTWWAARGDRRARLWPWTITVGLAVSMGTQLLLLAQVGRLDVGTALPLHLCSFMAVVTPLMLLLKSKALYSFSLHLGAPCALLALLFPAIADCAHPLLMSSAFYRLHVLILCGPFFLRLRGLPRLQDARPVLLAANGYLALVAWLNKLLGTNYLFLSQTPPGTPLVWLASRGGILYLCSLELLALLTITALAWIYQTVPSLWRGKVRHQGA